MLNCPYKLAFSTTVRTKRLEKAYGILGINVVKRIIGFVLFLLGANRQDIAQYLEVPFGTFLSFLTRVDKHGLHAFEDRRKSSAVPQRKLETSLSLIVQEKNQGRLLEKATMAAPPKTEHHRSSFVKILVPNVTPSIWVYIWFLRFVL